MTSQMETYTILPTLTGLAAQAASHPIARDVQTDISYYKLPEDGIPLPVIMNKDTRVDLSKCDWQLTTVYDVRGSLFNFTLDVAGFQFAKHKSSLDDYSDDAMVKERHYQEVVKLLETM
jgi:hypothetical protein